MAVNVNTKIRKLSAPQRKKVEARAEELIAEEMTLRELRTARRLTQVRMAKTLGTDEPCCESSSRRRGGPITLGPLQTVAMSIADCTYLLSCAAGSASSLWRWIHRDRLGRTN